MNGNGEQERKVCPDCGRSFSAYLEMCPACQLTRQVRENQKYVRRMEASGRKFKSRFQAWGLSLGVMVALAFAWQLFGEGTDYEIYLLVLMGVSILMFLFFTLRLVGSWLGGSRPWGAPPETFSEPGQ